MTRRPPRWLPRAFALGLAVLLLSASECPPPALPPSDEGELTSNPTTDLIVIERSWGSPPQRDLWRMFSNGTGQRRITSTPNEGERNPSLSPDGTKVAFTGDDGEFFVMRVDGTGLMQPAPEIQAEGVPAWANDGRHLVVPALNKIVVATRLYIVDSLGVEDPVLLLDEPGQLTLRDPTWSADGEWIAYAREDGALEQAILAVRADGTGHPVQLTETSSFARQPQWSASGLRLAFLGPMANSDGRLYTIRTPGGDPPVVPVDRNRWTRIHDGVDSFEWSPNIDEFAVTLADDFQVYTTTGPFDLSPRLTHWAGADQLLGGWSEALPLATVQDAVVQEGDEGTVELGFHIAVTAASDTSYYVYVSTVDAGGADAAESGVDFDPLDDHPVPFPAGGSLEQDVVVQVHGDTDVELQDEFVEIELTGSEVAALGDATAFGRIVEDDGSGGSGVELDPTFDGDGRVQTEINGKPAIAYAVAMRDDGRILAAGSYMADEVRRYMAVIGYQSNGALDFDFGSGGYGLVAFAQDAYAAAVAVNEDTGEVLAAGPANQQFGAIRFQADGEFDQDGFGGGDGRALADVSPGPDTATSMAIQPDGKFLVGGFVQPDVGSDHTEFAVVRFLPDGEGLDPDFGGGDGIVTTSFGDGRHAEANSLVLQPNGRILLGGSTRAIDSPSAPNDFAAARYLSDGTPDSDFSGDGKVVTPVAAGNDEANGAALADGKLVLAGQARRSVGTANDFAVVRYDTGGEPDATFDGDGITTTPIAITAQAQGVAVDAGGRLVVAGETLTGTDSLFAVARYLPSGAPDPAFNGGTQVFSAGGQVDAGFAVAIQPDGKIIVAGFTASGGPSRFALIRLIAP